MSTHDKSRVHDVDADDDIDDKVVPASAAAAAMTTIGALRRELEASRAALVVERQQRLADERAHERVATQLRAELASVGAERSALLLEQRLLSTDRFELDEARVTIDAFKAELRSQVR